MKPKNHKERDFEIKENNVYMTDVGDLVKINKIDEKNDKIHFYNISIASNVYLPLSRVLKYDKFIKKVR